MRHPGLPVLADGRMWSVSITTHGAILVVFDVTRTEGVSRRWHEEYGAAGRLHPAPRPWWRRRRSAGPPDRFRHRARPSARRRRGRRRSRPAADPARRRPPPARPGRRRHHRPGPVQRQRRLDRRAVGDVHLGASGQTVDQAAPGADAGEGAAQRSGRPDDQQGPGGIRIARLPLGERVGADTHRRPAEAVGAMPQAGAVQHRGDRTFRRAFGTGDVWRGNTLRHPIFGKDASLTQEVTRNFRAYRGVLMVEIDAFPLQFANIENFQK